MVDNVSADKILIQIKNDFDKLKQKKELILEAVEEICCLFKKYEIPITCMITKDSIKFVFEAFLYEFELKDLIRKVKAVQNARNKKLIVDYFKWHMITNVLDAIDSEYNLADEPYILDLKGLVRGKFALIKNQK